MLVLTVSSIALCTGVHGLWFACAIDETEHLDMGFQAEPGNQLNQSNFGYYFQSTLISILRTVFGTILQALQAKDREKVELNASQGWT